MPYTAAQLTSYYTLINQGVAPDGATALFITAWATQNAGGALTDAQTLSKVVNSSQTMATTDVATATYAFFTGTIPSAAGLAYLVNGSTNTQDLNDAYFTSFNQENRFYNFAINLAFDSTSATAFSTTYSALTLAQTIATAYETIVGTANVGTAAANAAIADITSRSAFFIQVAATRAVGLNQDLATKAVAIAYILNEAVKADVGTYAKAMDQFKADVAGGVAIYGTALTTTYGPGGAGYNIGIGGTGSVVGGTPGASLAFTGGIDNLNGTVNDDTFNATLLVNGGVAQAGTSPLVTTFQAADTAVGAGGNDTLNLTILDPAGGATGSITAPAAGVSGVRNIFVRGTSTNAADVDTIAAGNFSGAVQFIDDRSTNNMTFTGLAAGQAFGLNGPYNPGGATLALTATYGGTVTAETINLTGGVANTNTAANATTVTVTTGGNTAMVTATINSSGAANTVGATQLNAANSVTTLNVAANAGLTTGAITGLGSMAGGGTETVNITGNSAVTFGGLTGGGGNVANMNINVNNASTLTTGVIANAIFAANASLTVTGTSTTTTANAASVVLGAVGAAVKTLNASGLTSGGVSATVGTAAGVNAISFTGGGGTDILTIVATGNSAGGSLTGTFAGGAGNDIIAFSDGADLTAGLTPSVSGFETLRVAGTAGNNFDPTLITGITAYQINGGTGITMINLLANASVSVIASTAGTTTLNLANAGGATDVVNLTLNNQLTTGTNTSGVTVAGLTTGGNSTPVQVETLNVTSAGRVAGTGTYNFLTLSAENAGPNFTSASKIVVTGASGLNLTTGTLSHSLTVDASAATGGITFTTAGTFVGATTGTLTVTGTGVNDTLTVGNATAGNSSVVIGGAGGDSINLGLNAQTVQYTKATDSQLNIGETDAANIGNNNATTTTLLAGTSGNGVANTGSMDIINGFGIGVDKIDVTAFTFTGQKGGVADAGTVTSDAAMTALLQTAGLFLQGANTRGAVQIHGTAAMSSGVAGDFIVIDANNDGVYTAGSDLVIKLQGVAAVTAADFNF